MSKASNPDTSIHVVKSIYGGLDVHKKVIVATVCIFRNRQTMIPEFHQKSFSTFNSELVELANWLKSFNCDEVYMESTGKYSTPVFDVLEQEGLKPHIVNPKYTRAIKGKKNDKKDSKWIAELACYDLLVDSCIPKKKIRVLRRISRRRIKLTQSAADEKRRIQNIMTEGNLKLDQIFTDTTGKSSLAVLSLLIKKGTDASEEELLKCVRKNVIKRTQLPEAIKGMHLTDDIRFLLKSVIDNLKNINDEILNCQTKMAEMCREFQGYVDQLLTIPGISTISAMSIIAEIGVDMSQFQDVNHFISWRGLAPTDNESAGKKKSVKIGKGGKYLKPMLVQATCVAVKKSKNTYYKEKFNRIAKRRGTKRALVAIARKMLVAIYQMFLTGETFNPVDQKRVQEQAVQSTTDEKQTDSKLNEIINSVKANIDMANGRLRSQLLEILGVSQPINPQLLADASSGAI